MNPPAWLGSSTVVVVALSLTAPGVASAGNVADCPGIFYDVPATGSVEHTPAGTITVGHAARLKVKTGAEFAAGSATFEIDGPTGHESVPASNESGEADWTPKQRGHYTIAAKWRQYRCRDASAPTYADGSAPGVGADVVAPRTPRAFFKTRRLPKRGNSRGSASITGGVRCPSRATASNESIVIAVYWETGGAEPTYASRHLRATLPTGCYGRLIARSRSHQGKGFFASVHAGDALVNVFAPTRLRVLFEVRRAGRLIGRRQVRFAPTAFGESVVNG